MDSGARAWVCVRPPRFTKTLNNAQARLRPYIPFLVSCQIEESIKTTWTRGQKDSTEPSDRRAGRHYLHGSHHMDCRDLFRRARRSLVKAGSHPWPSLVAGSALEPG